MLTIGFAAKTVNRFAKQIEAKKNEYFPIFYAFRSLAKNTKIFAFSLQSVSRKNAKFLRNKKF